MSIEHIHADIVGPDGRPRPILQNPDFTWGKPARKSYRTAQIKPETRDAILDVLASAADSIETLTKVNIQMAGDFNEVSDAHAEQGQEIADLLVSNRYAWESVTSYEKFIPIVFIVGLALGCVIGWCFHP